MNRFLNTHKAFLLATIIVGTFAISPKSEATPSGLDKMKSGGPGKIRGLCADIDECVKEARKTHSAFIKGSLLADDTVAAFKSIKDLDLKVDRPNNDTVLQFVGKLTNLKRYTVGRMSRITDDGLKHLENLKDLESLDLGFNTKITDAGLTHLQTLQKLQVLRISGSKITDAGINELKKHIPQLKVDLGSLEQ